MVSTTLSVIDNIFIIILTSQADVLVFVLLCIRDSQRMASQNRKTCKKVKQSHYRPRQTLWVPEG